jgi:hypothetical protein
METSCNIALSMIAAGATNVDPTHLFGGMVYLGGGSIGYQDFGNWGDTVQSSSGLLSSFDGQWVTLNQFVGMVNSYYATIGTLSDDERLSAIARGVVTQGGAVADWRFIVGFYGASLFGASGQITSSLASLDTVTVAVGEGESAGIPLFHTAVEADGQWISAWGKFGNMTMEGGSDVWAENYSWFRFSVPVLNPGAVAATSGTVVMTCVSGVCNAILNGWFK